MTGGVLLYLCTEEECHSVSLNNSYLFNPVQRYKNDKSKYKNNIILLSVIIKS